LSIFLLVSLEKQTRGFRLYPSETTKRQLGAAGIQPSAFREIFRKRRLDMDLGAYFEQTKGRGVLASADGNGLVDAAVYARPHFMGGGKLAFIMRDRLTHHNLQTNDHAAYLFMEDGPGYKGVRLFLTKVDEEENSELIDQLSRRKYAVEEGAEGKSRFLVTFTVDKILPLVGDGKTGFTVS
jgi:hypothetical protein